MSVLTRHAARTPLRRSLRRSVARIAAIALLAPLGIVAVVVAAQPASAAGVVAPTRLASSGFPSWYEDPAGTRLEPCLDPADANCVAAPASATYNPALPLAFPSNYPDEFFYAVTTSDLLATTGCQGTAPGKASVRLALEGAFVNGDPAAGDQMTFGRIRVKVTSGLCPDTDYQFRHPFGIETFHTNAAGAIPATVGTQDIGCVPTPGAPCDYSIATGSRVFGTAARGGFLRWDASAPLAPQGYLGDGATSHAIIGGTTGNDFAILDATGHQLNDANGAPYQTNQFVVAGKIAGSLTATPDPIDLGGQEVTTTSGATTVTVTNVDATAVTIPAGGVTVRGAASPFAVTGGSCVDAVNPVTVAHDATCTVQVTVTPTALGVTSDTLDVVSTGGVRSPLSVVLTATGTTAGAAPVVSAAPSPVAFGDVRLRTISTKQVTLTNTGDAPLRVTAFDLTNSGPGSGASQYRLLTDTCSVGTIAAGATCTVDVTFAPFSSGVHNASLEITSNAGTANVPLVGNGTGGVAAVSNTVAADDGFPDWYRDENGVKISQCIDPKDPNCVVLPDGTYDPALDLTFPSNFPGEFFYTVADSDIITTPGCDGGPTGKAFIRHAVEATFINGDPVDGEQIMFGRNRISVTGGLCPDTEYTFINPYGAEKITTNGAGAVPRNVGTSDVGCFPVAPATCDFSLPLSAAIFGGFLRWDPAVAPAAPSGYIGDAATLHKVVGAPYLDNGVPANYFKIVGPDGATVGETDLYTVMGKLRGPLEVVGGVTPAGHVDAGAIAQGSTTAPTTVTLRNTGLTSITVNSSAIAGADATDFTVAGGNCVGITLPVGAQCTIDVTFSPTEVGNRSAILTIGHTGLNNPLDIVLDGVGGAVGSSSVVSFQPRSVSFAPLHTGRTSAVTTVTVSNVGGTLPLDVLDAVIAGAAPTQFAIADNRCTALVAPNATCQIDVVFTPSAAGTANGTLKITDNAPGGTHQIPLTGTGVTANRAVSGQLTADGYPTFYQDENATRLEPCLDSSGNCVVLADAGFNPANALQFPSNYPSEFFYAVADSELLSLPGCAGTPAGTALLRVGLEGSFVNGTPVVGDQSTFTRVRMSVTGGLCANTPYKFVTPYGVFSWTTNATGGLPKNAGTQDVGCGAAPCAFTDALVSPAPGGQETPIEGFLRWDPNVGTAAPAGYLGDAKAFRPVVGGTYVPLNATAPVNKFEITDTAGNSIASTDKFLVAGKIAGPLFGSVASLAFPNTAATTTSAVKNVVVTNSGSAPATITTALTGLNATDYTITANTCTAPALAPDTSCTVTVAFSPALAGAKTANLVVTPSTSTRTLTVRLTGTADAAPSPGITVTPGILAYGTITAPASSTLSTLVRNTGTGSLRITGAALGGAGASDYSVVAAAAPATDCGALPITVAPGATCSIAVKFTPTANGARPGTLTLTHNAPGGSTIVSLSGTGLGSAFSLSPSPIGITANRGSTKSQSVTVKNSGTIAMRFTSFVPTGADAAFFTVTANTCPAIGAATPLAAGKSCSIQVNFSPTNAGGARNYTAKLVTTGDTSSLPATVTVQLTGTGK